MILPSQNLSIRRALRVALVAVALLAGLAVAAPQAGAATDPNTLYVSVAGNDSSDGQTPSTSWRTISHAIKKVQPGQTIFVMDGTYTDYLYFTQSGREGAWIRLTAAPGHSPVIEATSGNAIQVLGSYVEVSGFEIRGVGYSASNHAGYGIIAERTHHVTIQNNTVHGFPTGGINGYQSSHVSAAYNVVYENALWSPHQGSGISFFQSTNKGFGDDKFSFSNYIVGNTVYANENRVPASYGNGTEVTDGNGIIVDSSKSTGYTGRTLIANNVSFNNGGRGINVFRSDHVLAIQNTSYRNSTSSALRGTRSEIGLWESSNLLIANNILIPIEGSQGVAGEQGNTVGGNFVVGNSAGLFPNDVYSDSIVLVNMTTDPNTADFRLGQGSTAIARGWPYAPGLERPDPGAFPVGSARRVMTDATP